MFISNFYTALIEKDKSYFIPYKLILNYTAFMHFIIIAIFMQDKRNKNIHAGWILYRYVLFRKILNTVIRSSTLCTRVPHVYHNLQVPVVTSASKTPASIYAITIGIHSMVLHVVARGLQVASTVACLDAPVYVAIIVHQYYSSFCSVVFSSCSSMSARTASRSMRARSTSHGGNLTCSDHQNKKHIFSKLIQYKQTDRLKRG